MSRLARPRAKLNLQHEVLELLERQFRLKAIGRSLNAPRSIATLIEVFETTDASSSTLAQMLTAELSLKENELPKAGTNPRRRGTADDFWIDAGLGDISITRAVFTSGEHFDDATEPYRIAFKNRSTVRERLSVLDHLRDLVALRPRNSVDVTKLTKLIASLESAGS